MGNPAKALPPVEQIRSHLSYDPETGILTRLSTGKPTGSLDQTGHLRVWLLGESHAASRIAWKLYHGTEPEYVDHIDRDTTNNRISNLRSVSHQVNCTNRRIKSDNTSGVAGVQWVKRNQKWRVVIGVNGKRTSLGHYDNILDAVAVRKSAEQSLGYL